MLFVYGTEGTEEYSINLKVLFECENNMFLLDCITNYTGTHE